LIDFVFIPLLAILVSAAFGSVSIVWDSERRATRSMCALFVCTGGWAFVDLLTYMEADPARALEWMRWSHLSPMMVGPTLLWVVAQMLPQSRRRLEGHARTGAVVSFVIGVGAAFIPGITLDMIPNGFGGYMPVYGPVALVLIPMGTILPLYAAIEATRIEARADHRYTDERRSFGLRVSVLLAMGVAIPSEFVLPLLEIPVPRLGAFGSSFAAAIVWLAILADTEDLMVTPSGVARTLLADLHDGIALVALDGMILSSNLRFAEMTGRPGSTLLGTKLGTVFDAPMTALQAGLEDRETMLHVADGGTIPVSLSSSIATSRTGQAIGIVVIVRDRRDIDALRAQLLRSGRLAAIGELAAGIAHEVNNPVAFIRADLNLLEDRLGEIRERIAANPVGGDSVAVVDRASGRVSRALKGIEHVAQVVVDVREFAHVGGAGQGGSDPESVVEGALRLARMERGDDVDLRITNIMGGERIESGQELKQVLLALIRALAANTEKGGRVEVELRADPGSTTVGLAAMPLKADRAAVRARFESFGTEPGEPIAAEIGLASAAELLEQLGGQLYLDDEGAAGLRVEISVPRSELGVEA